jgi:hypothetical protein
MQLQYVQTVILNFPLLPAGKPPVPFSWPHVSVATLRKTFGGIRRTHEALSSMPSRLHISFRGH